MESEKGTTYKVLHIITGLGVGGAEISLQRLLTRLPALGGQPQVVSLTSGGAIGEKIRAAGIPLLELNMRPGKPDLASFLRLRQIIQAEKPDLVQTWLYHADLLGGLAAKLNGRIPVVWGVHHTDLSRAGMKRSTLWTVRTCAALSRFLPSRIVFVSEVSRQVHLGLGYPAEKTVVIPNGYDLSEFAPNPAARAEVRAELGIAPTAPVVGLVARFNPQKDHLNFLQAAQILRDRLPEVVFVLCGDGVSWDNAQLSGWIRERGLEGNVQLLGRRNDVASLMNAMDVLCSSSAAEALPNVIGEAMACGLPCVVTDAGDSGKLVENTGRVVPVRDAAALADGLWSILSLPAGERAALGWSARQRIEENFSLEASAKAYDQLYRDLTQRP